MRHLLEKYEFGCSSAHAWTIDGLWPVEGTMDLAQRVATQVRCALWRNQAKRRMHLRGLDHGRDKEMMDGLMSEIRSPKHVAMLGVIISDSVYTPARARAVGI